MKPHWVMIVYGLRAALAWKLEWKLLAYRTYIYVCDIVEFTITKLYITLNINIDNMIILSICISVTS